MSKHHTIRSFCVATLCVIVLYNAAYLRSSDAALESILIDNMDNQVNTVLEEQDFANFNTLAHALVHNALPVTSDEQASALHELITLVTQAPDNQDEVKTLFAQIFSPTAQDQLDALYARSTKEIAVLALLRAARDRSRDLRSQLEVFWADNGLEKSPYKAAQLLMDSYQGAKLYQELTDLYQGELPDDLEKAFTDLERIGRNLYPVFDLLLRNTVGPLRDLGFEVTDFSLMMEPYGILLKMLRSFTGTHQLKKLMNSVWALDYAYITADSDAYDDVISNGQYTYEIVTLALYRGLLTDIMVALEKGELAVFVQGIQALVVRAGVGVEESPEYQQRMREVKEALLVEYFRMIVARVQALNEGTITYQEHDFIFDPPHSSGWDQPERDARIKTAIAESRQLKPLYDMIKNTNIEDIDTAEFIQQAKYKVWGSVFEMDVLDDTLRSTWLRQVTRPDDYEDLLIQERKRLQDVILQYLQRQAVAIKILQEYVQPPVRPA